MLICNKKLFEAVKGAMGGYNTNTFSAGVGSSLMRKTANVVKKVVILKSWFD